MKEDKLIPEVTFASVTLGVVLAVILCAANVYLGLKAGMTISASIPAAVISMGILRGVLKRGTILENNIVQTIASSGESLAAGIIFTMPALVMAGIWSDFDYWTVMLVSLLGGMLGILFMIPLRKPLIVNQTELAFPEGVACAEVLKAGQRKGSGIIYLSISLVAGLVIKFFTSGASIIKDSLHGALRLGDAVFPIAGDISIALLGVGYIVKLNIALLVFVGGAIAWLVSIPIYTSIHGISNPDDLFATAQSVWKSHIRFMGVGAMVVGGIWSIIKIFKSILIGFKEAVRGYKSTTSGMETPVVKRTEQDLSMKHLGILLVITVIAVHVLYYSLTGSIGITVVSGVSMIICSFFFVAVAAYIVGLVGSSNSPVSGMTICAILFASGLLYLFGMTGQSGMLAALVVGGVVCCAACSSGDITQDLKTGHLVGSTPKQQQIMEIVGAVSASVVIAPVLSILHKSYGIGVDREGALAAPQASLFKSLTEAMFTHGDLKWNMIFIGAVIGIALIIIDEILSLYKTKFRAYVMPVAIGIYLPIALSVTILVGGIASAIVSGFSRTKEDESDANDRGVLIASGLIAGEALMGITIGIIITLKSGLLPVSVLDSDVLTLSVFALVFAGLIFLSLKGRKT
ncbi:MAG: oligopeptide transporter, OPT family [Planctomycetes bacterium]|nr:oligopeptide transporter, OPT family [Planctomycetota bacterium]